MSDATTAVIVMAYGTPRSPDDILEYYTDIRRGRPPTDEQLADLTARYEAIGGISPLAQLTEAQVDTIRAALEAEAPGRFHVTIGLKHAAPMIETAVEEVAALGITRAVGLVLAPHWSTFSVGQYLGRMKAAAEPHGIEVTGVESWATEPAYIEFIAEDLQRRIEHTEGNYRVVFTAHSLPERIIAAGDTYPDELRATAEAVADAVGLTEHRDWQIGWQSAGRTPEPWLGPDILEVIDQLAASDESIDDVIVAPVGFTADHLEVLYDLDIEARDYAEDRGLRFDRTASVNDHEGVMAALAQRVRAADRDLDAPAE